MPNYAVLAAEIAKPAYADMNDEQIAALLNAASVTIPANVSVGDVEGYLRINARIAMLEDWIAANTTPTAARYAARELLGILSGKITVLETADPTKRAALQNMFAEIVAASAGGITQADSNALFGLAQAQTSWAAQNGWPTIGLGDVAKAKVA